MIALALDCSTEYLSLALMNKGNIIGFRHERIGNRHSDVLLHYINDLCAESEIKRSDICQIFVGQGPGSFTGIRITLGVARALTLGLQAQSLGQSSLHLIAAQAPNEGLVHVLVDARMQRCYSAQFLVNNGSPQLIGVIQEVEPSKVEINPEARLVGNGWGIFAEEFSDAPNISGAVPELYPDARAFSRFEQNILNRDKEALIPIYVRNDVATPKKRPILF